MKMDRMNPHAKNVFAVLGISRSGTSAIARSLKACGIDLGSNLLAGDERNPKGFYEDADILYKINRGVSHALDDPWMTVGSLDKASIAEHPILKNYRNYAINLLQERLAKTAYWGFKDPRTTSILPFWQSVFDAIPVNDHYVIALRNPLAVAYSNKKFANLDLEVGMMLWLIHSFAAVEGTYNKKRVVISYEAMLQDAPKQLQRIHTAFSLPFSLATPEVEQYQNEFLDKSLSHYAADDGELKKHPVIAIVPLCWQVYELLLSLAEDRLTFDSVEFQFAWRQIQDEFAKVYPIYQWIHRQLKQHQTVEKDLRRMHRSISWKLIYPIRKMDEIFRRVKKKSKEAKRLR